MKIEFAIAVDPARCSMPPENYRKFAVTTGFAVDFSPIFCYTLLIRAIAAVNLADNSEQRGQQNEDDPAELESTDFRRRADEASASELAELTAELDLFGRYPVEWLKQFGPPSAGILDWKIRNSLNSSIQKEVEE